MRSVLVAGVAAGVCILLSVLLAALLYFFVFNKAVDSQVVEVRQNPEKAHGRIEKAPSVGPFSSLLITEYE